MSSLVDHLIRILEPGVIVSKVLLQRQQKKNINQSGRYHRRNWSCPELPALFVVLELLAFLGLPIRSSAAAWMPSHGTQEFDVLNSDATQVIGRSSYRLSPGVDGLLIGHGEAHYKDGEYDVESDTLRPRPGQLPQMLTLNHQFFNADGSLQRTNFADFRTGQASCTHYQEGVAKTSTATLDFTPDSFGGSAVVLPLQQALAQGASKPMKLHAFNCIPGPRLIAVRASAYQPSHWSHYPGQSVELDIEPDLGFLSTVIAPLLPKLRAWVDPARNWQLVGAQFSRYFRGPQIILVRETKDGKNER
jgi:hypothetical protein